VAQGGRKIDVASLLADRPNLIDRDRRLVEGLESIHQPPATGGCNARLVAGWAHNKEAFRESFPGELHIGRPVR
jgi:hypothetical protein